MEADIGVKFMNALVLCYNWQGPLYRAVRVRVSGGVHDSYSFQCGLVGSFTSPGINSFLPKYRVKCYDYIIKWCSGI